MLTVAGAARLLGVHANTVRAWTDQGRLPCLRINRRGDRRYPAAELERFLSSAGADPRAQEAEALSALRATADLCNAADDFGQLLVQVGHALGSVGYDAVAYAPVGSAVRQLLGSALDRQLVRGVTGRSGVRSANLAGGARRALALPIGDQQPAGVLHLQRPEPGRWPTTMEKTFLLALAAQLGGAETQLGRLARVDEERRRAELLLAVSSDISSQLDLSRILGQLIDHAVQLFSADHATIVRRREDDSFAVDITRNLGSQFSAVVESAPRLPLLAEAWETRAVATAVDYAADPRASYLRDAMVREGINTASVAPLISDEELVGGLALFHDRPYHWRPDDRKTFEQLARQGAVAIGNARMWSRTATWAAQLQSIQQLGARLTRLSTVREIGQAIAAELHQLIDYHNVRVYRVYGADVVPVAWRGHVGEYAEEDPEQLQLHVGEGITGWVAEHGVAQNLGNAARDPRTQTIPGTEDDLDESLLVAPMLYEDAVIGVIVLAKLGLNQFTGDDLRLLEIYASIATQAMANADTTERLRQQSEALAQQLASQRELLRVTESILGTLDTQVLLHEIAERLGTITAVDNLCVYLLDDSPDTFHPIFARGTDADELLATPLPTSDAIAAWVMRTGEPKLLAADSTELGRPAVAPRGSGNGALLVAPLRGREGVSGLFLVERLGSEARFSSDEFELIRLFAGHVSIALQNAKTHRAVELRAQTDALTGLKNHGSLMAQLARAVQRADGFALLMLDLDHFKTFNDQRGHEAGNALLVRIAEVLRSSCRDSDEIFRYGGDEFAIILPQTSLAGALAVAEKLSGAIGRAGGRRSPRVSCSVGVAVQPADGPDAGSILVAADRACYLAKRRGRGQIATAAEGLTLAGEFLPSAPTPVDIVGGAYSPA